MKKLSFLVLVSLLVMMTATMASAQSKLSGKKDRSKAQATVALIKSLKQEGWALDAQEKTLEEAMMEHKKALESDGNSAELIGEAVSSGSLSALHAEAVHNAAVSYGKMARKHVMLGAEEMKQPLISSEELDLFADAYERLLTQSFEKGMQESLAMYKAVSGRKTKYHVYYLVDEEKASKLRVDAMNQAAQEVNASKEFIDHISSYVVDRFFFG